MRDFLGTSISEFFNNIRRFRPSLDNIRVPDGEETFGVR